MEGVKDGKWVEGVQDGRSTECGGQAEGGWGRWVGAVHHAGGDRIQTIKGDACTLYVGSASGCTCRVTRGIVGHGKVHGNRELYINISCSTVKHVSITHHSIFSVAEC